MFKLNRIHLRNWQRVREATVEFPDYGLVYVAGVNNAAKSGSAESIGSGKTALGEALFLPLFGAASKNPDVADNSTDDMGNTYVRIDGQWNEHALTCELGYKALEFPSSTGAGLRWTVGGDVYERGHIRDTREALSGFFGLSPHLAAWSLFVDGDHLRFNDLTAVESVSLFNEAMRLPDWERCQEQSKVLLSEAKTACERANSALEETKRRMPQLDEELVLLRADHDAVNTKVAEAIEALERTECTVRAAETAHGRAKEAVQRAKEALSAAQQVAAAGISRSALTAAEDAETEWARLERKDKFTLQEAEEALKCAKDTTARPCRLCGSNPGAKVADPVKVAKCTQAVDAAKAAVEESSQSLAAWRAELSDQRRVFDAAKRDANIPLRPLEDGLRSADDALEQAADDWREARERRSDAKATLARFEAERAGIIQQSAKFTQQLTECKARVTQLAETAAAADQSQKLYAYWARAFSPNGLPTSVVSSVVDAMNAAAAGVGVSLGGDIIRLWFDTTGGARPRIRAKFKSILGAGVLNRASKGEYGLANLAIAETLYTVARPASKVRWFDECLNSQDSTVRRLVYTYLRDQARRERSLIFVVDHDVATAGLCDFTLTAEKSSDGWTSYRW